MSTEFVKTPRAPARQSIQSGDLDYSLLQRMARQDRIALQELFQRHYARVMGFFSELALERQAVEELTVDTFLTAWNTAGSFEGHLPVSMWLLELGYRCVLRSTEECRDRIDLGADDQPGETPQMGFDSLSHARRLCAIGHLPISQRVALELTYHLRHSREEIAAIMGCSVANVHEHVSAARRGLLGALCRLTSSRLKHPAPGIGRDSLK